MDARRLMDDLEQLKLEVANLRVDADELRRLGLAGSTVEVENCLDEADEAIDRAIGELSRAIEGR